MKKNILLLAAAAFLLAGCDYGTTSASSSGTSSSYSPIYVPEEEYQVPDDVGDPVVLSETLSISLSEMDVETEEGGRLYFPVQVGEEEVLFRVEGGTVLEDGGIHLDQGGYLTNVTPIQGIDDVSWVGESSEDAFPMERVSAMTIVDPFLGGYVTNGENVLPESTDGLFFSIGPAIGTLDLERLSIGTKADSSVEPNGKAGNLSFYSLNDTHGAVSLNEENGEPGIAVLGNYLREGAKSNPEGTVILSAGDMWQGSADSNLTHGGIMVDWMNLVGFDAMSIGNHEFDWGVSYIEQNLAKANFPFLGINIRDPEGNTPYWAAPSTIIQRGGWRIGVVGAIGDLESSIAVSSLGGYELGDDFRKLSEEEAKRLKEEEDCDFVAILIHNGSFPVSQEGSEYIDLVFEGHTHRGYVEVDEYGIPHAQGWANGGHLNRLDFVYEETTGTFQYDGNVQYSGYEMTYGGTPDKDVEDLIEQYSSLIDPIKNEVLDPSFQGMSESEIAVYSTEAMLHFYQEKYEGRYEIVAAFSNTGCARTNLADGPLTYGALYQALPFDNDNVLVELSGQSLSYLLGDGYLAAASEISRWEVDLDKKDYHAIVLSYVSEKSSYASLMEEIERDSQNRQRDIFAEAIRSGDY